MAKSPNQSGRTARETKAPRSKAARPEVMPLGKHLAAWHNPALNQYQLGFSKTLQALGATCELFQSEFARVIAPFVAEQERAGVEVARITSHLSASFACVTESITKPLEAFRETLASVLEEQRLQKRILELGFVPHPVLFEYLGGTEKPSELVIGELAHALADEVWPKVRPALELSRQGCLGDLKIFHTFNEIIRAHEAGLYQLTTPSAFFVIERAARLAQQNSETTERTKVWLETGIGGLPWDALSSQCGRTSIGVWAVLYEHSFTDCRTDVFADAATFPHRHTAAHGYGTKIYSVVDSMNSVLLAHFVVIAASAFQAYEREQPIKTSEE